MANKSKTNTKARAKRTVKSPRRNIWMNPILAAEGHALAKKRGQTFSQLLANLLRRELVPPAAVVAPATES